MLFQNEMSSESFLMLKLFNNGNLGIEIILWVFSSSKLFFIRKSCLYHEERAVHVSFLGIVSANLQGHAWLRTLLLQPLEGLLWPHSCRTGPWLSPFMHGAKEMKSHHRALRLSDKCS